MLCYIISRKYQISNPYITKKDIQRATFLLSTYCTKYLCFMIYHIFEQKRIMQILPNPSTTSPFEQKRIIQISYMYTHLNNVNVFVCIP